MPRELSYRASRRLSDVADKASREVLDYVDDEDSETAQAIATDLVTSDQLLRGAVEAQVALDTRANDRRKTLREEGGDPFNDDVLTSLREARSAARDAVEQRVSEVVGEVVDYTADVTSQVEA